MSLLDPDRPVQPERRLASNGALALGTGALAALLAGALAVILESPPPPAPTLTVAGGIAALAMLALALARYEAAVVLGMLIIGVVFVDPAPPDAVFMVVMAAALVTGRFSLRGTPGPILGLIGVFLVLNIVSTVFAIYPGRAAVFFSTTAYLCIFSVWLAGYVDSAARARTVLRPLIAGAVASSVIAVVALYANVPARRILLPDANSLRARGFFKDPNVFGPFCVLAALLVVSELLEPRLMKGRRLTKLAILAVLSIGVVFAFSRAAWLNAAVGVFTMFAIYGLRRGGGRNAAAILVALALVAGTASFALAATGSVGFLDQRAGLQSYDLNRFAAQEKGLQLVREYPLGIGPGQFERVVDYASHSTYVRTLAEQGVLGLLVGLGILLGTLGLAVRNAVLGRDTFGIGSTPLLGAWCGLLANSAFVDTLHWRHLWLVAALIWAGAMRSSASMPPIRRPAGAVRRGLP